MCMDGAPRCRLHPATLPSSATLKHCSRFLEPRALGIATSLSLSFFPLFQLYYLESGPVTTRVFHSKGL